MLYRAVTNTVYKFHILLVYYVQIPLRLCFLICKMDLMMVMKMMILVMTW